MDLKQNSFFILKATLDDSRTVLAEKAEDLEFELGEEICQKCLTDLINPKRRLYSEIRWFLDETEDEIREIISNIDSHGVVQSVSSYLSSLNLIDYWYNYKDKSIPNQIKCLTDYYKAIQGISSEDVVFSINHHRKNAGFTEASFADVSAELNSYLSEIENKVLAAVFDFTPRNQAELILRFAKSISSKQKPYPEWGFPQAVVSRYELLNGDQINESEEAIIHLINSEKNRYTSFTKNELFERIDKKLTEWEAIAKPINYINYTNDVHRKSSMNMLCSIREFVLYLNNNREDYTGALDLNRILISHCEYFPGLIQDLKKGSSTIQNNQNIAVQNQRIREQRERQERYDKTANGVKLFFGIGIFIFMIVMCSL